MPLFKPLLYFVYYLLCFSATCMGHGFMESPRSRNYVAFQDGKYWPLEDSDPKKEECPHCLNLGGTLGRCGVTANRNYDEPKNANGGPFTPTVREMAYEEGADIIIDVVLTAHHKGHFVYKACSVAEGEVATQSCFDSNPLEFVEDMMYGAPKDVNFTERAYIAPTNHLGAVQDSASGVYGMRFSHKFRLPMGLTGDLVLLQWHYLTANSCVYDGYDQYPFPDSTWVNSALGNCTNIPEDGNGVPEQFWNCAEVSISSAGPTVSTPTPPSAAPSQPPTPPSPTSTSPSPSSLPTRQPSVTPTPSPTTTPTGPSPTPGSPCCPSEHTGLMAYDGCTKFYHCVNGAVVGQPISCGAGTLFDQALSVCNWENMVNCVPESCGGRMLRG